VNQASNGSSQFPSAGNIFFAYVLRPNGTNQYDVVFNSSLLTVPTLTTPGISDIATFPVTPFTVLAGDVIGFYGQGIPVNTGTGTDILSTRPQHRLLMAVRSLLEIQDFLFIHRTAPIPSQP